MNFTSPEWQEVAKEIDKQIAILDRKNRAVKLGADETASIRGQIVSLLWLKDWPEREKPQPESGVDLLV